jgi:hypothetical protein
LTNLVYIVTAREISIRNMVKNKWNSRENKEALDVAQIVDALTDATDEVLLTHLFLFRGRADENSGGAG